MENEVYQFKNVDFISQLYPMEPKTKKEGISLHAEVKNSSIAESKDQSQAILLSQVLYLSIVYKCIVCVCVKIMHIYMLAEVRKISGI